MASSSATSSSGTEALNAGAIAGATTVLLRSATGVSTTGAGAGIGAVVLLMTAAGNGEACVASKRK